jgi:gas vesicle protein
MRVASAMLAAFVLAGCVSSHVRTGATIGAISGAAAGAGVGVLISDDSLLGSEDSTKKGDTSIAIGETVAASAAIGVAFGAIVGAMVGHVNEPRYGRELNQAAGDLAPSPETAPDAVEPETGTSLAPTTFRF